MLYARIVVALVLGAWLSWQIVAAGFAGLAARSRDPRLLTIMGTSAHPDAGAIRAEAMLATGDKTGAARIARNVVLVDPTGDRALRVLGMATEALGDRDAGSRIMNQAGGLGWRDTPTQLWVLKDAALRDDAVTVIQRADALARRNRSTDLTRAIFIAAVTEPTLRTALIDSLARQPVWRTAFFSDVRQRLPASAIPGMEAFLREMQKRGQPVSPDEWLNYVDRLIDLGDYRRARALWAHHFAIPTAWLRTAPYDGDFALVAARAPDAPTSQFEWTVDPNLVGLIDFGSGTKGKSLSFPAEIASGTAITAQLMILSPGSHMLSARISGNPGAAEWGVTCLPSGRAVPRRLPRGPDDALSNVAFDVPATDCGAQRLTLTARERLDMQPTSIAAVRIR